MGCVQGKMDSPPRGLQKLKMENGYVGKVGFVGHRRSTGQRYSDSGRVPKPELHRKRSSLSGANEEKERIQRRNEAVADGKEGNFNDNDKEKERTQRRSDAVENKNILIVEQEMVDGWPKWLIDNIPKEVLAGLVPKSAESYEKLDKIGQGTYSNVYKARDRETGKIVALKKVRFDTSEPESVKFMAREIMILQKLDHPNVVKLEGLATSRMQYSLYLVFEFMQADLTRIISRPEERLTEPQIKCYMHQLLSGLQHCHERGILHRDIKGSNLLIDKNGMLKIADFGLANCFSPNRKYPLTSRVVTLWYRAPELLLGSTDYGVGIDLWSAGCLLAEMFAARPIMPGRTEVEQLHKIFKLCGTPSEEYWKKLRLSTTFRPPQSYKPSLVDAFRNFPRSSLGLLSTLLALDPAYRGSAASALQNEGAMMHVIPKENFGSLNWLCALAFPILLHKSISMRPFRPRNPKMKRRSRTLRESRKQVELADHKEDTMFLREDTEKTAGPNVEVQEPGSSTTTSTSSSSKHTRPMSPSNLLSPVASSGQKTSPSTQVHSSASRNIQNRPPLPGSQTRVQKDNGNMYRLNQVGRSASTREFRTLNQRKHLEYAIDD
ncbi:hypothetical protein COLO4_03363 [Corchorus olitorius]|uniref:Protein kinase domain-containing protein n=1 Tax=Corchorus olitorius TaxID=93759 RepID=A0A1R3KYT4_9ROSI|nr:hypothetical protein COLO4_03363 [Corchorus olitorius]